jgi:hypothetical protein
MLHLINSEKEREGFHLTNTAQNGQNEVIKKGDLFYIIQDFGQTGNNANDGCKTIC